MRVTPHFLRVRPRPLFPQVVAFVSFYLLGYSPTFWALGNSILGSGDDEDAACLTAGTIDDCKGPTLVDKAKKALVAFLKPPPVRAALAGLFVATTPLSKTGPHTGASRGLHLWSV